jgi:hypothetical protein
MEIAEGGDLNLSLVCMTGVSFAARGPISGKECDEREEGEDTGPH